MRKDHALRWLIASLSLAFAVLACSLLTGSVEPAPTETPPEATGTPLASLTHTTAPTPLQETELTIEPEQTSEATAPKALVPQDEIGVYKLNWYLDNYDSWHVVGLIMNNTDRPVDSLEVEVSALDANGNTIYEEISTTALQALAPGGITPFSLTIWEQLPEMESFTATIVGQSSSDREHTEVQVRGARMSFDENSVHVTGEYFNHGNAPVEIHDAAAATFDADGNLVTANAEYAAISYLYPGDSGPFRVTMDRPAAGTATITDFSVYANAEIVEQAESFTITYLEDRSYLDSDGYLHVVGKLKNDSEVNLNIALVAGLYDQDGNVLDADSIATLPLSSLAPGETVSYDFDSWGPIDEVEGLFELADSYTVQWDPAWTWETSTTYVDISAIDVSSEHDDFWGAIFSGQVENDYGEALAGATVMVNLYDPETGVLLATGYENIFEELPAGSTADYEVTILVEDDFDLDTVEHEIIAKGELP